MPLPSPAECKAIRQAAGISRRTLAPIVGVGHLTIWRWENDKSVPINAVMAARYARGLTYLATELAKQQTTRTLVGASAA